MIKFPIDTKDLYQFLPHRPPMVWVKSVLSQENEKGECLIELSKGSLFLDNNGQVKRSSYIEFMAQSIGYIISAKMLQKNKKQGSSKTFMALVSKVSYPENCPNYEEKLICKAERVRVSGEISFIEASVHTFDRSKILAKASLRLFSTE